MRVVFIGTAAFAVPSLRALVATGHEVSLVVTQPDRPGNRLVMTPPAVKLAATELRLQVLQPAKVRESLPAIQQAKPELIVVVAYGQIIPPSVLAAAPRGILNVHASLLPRWRGAAPVAHTILAGDEVTGVTIIQMDEQLDHGPILASRETAVGRGENATELTERLAKLGGDLLVETIARLDVIEPREQDEALVRLAPKLRRQDGELDWSLPAAEIVRRLRAYTPWPGVTLPWGSGRIKLLAAHSRAGDARPGEIVGVEGSWLQVGTADGVLWLMEVQIPNRRPMPAAQLVAQRA